HVNFARNARGTFAYVTVGALNEVQVFRTDDFRLVAHIPVGKLPHGIWPSGDGTRMYVGLENEDALAVIDTLENKAIASIPIDQAPQAVVYVPNAAPEGGSVQGLVPIGIAGSVAHLTLGGRSSASLFDQGLIQVLQVAAVGLEPKQPYVLGLAGNPDGGGNF